MTRRSAIFLQAAVAFVGVAIFVFLLWEPNVEGRNAHATLFATYFNDPFLACAYLAAIPFFVALCRAFQLLGRAGRNDLYSPRSLNDLQIIQYCMIAVVGCVAMGEAYLFIVVRGTDDIAGGVAMGIVVAVLMTAIAIAATVFARNLRNRMGTPRS